MSSFKWTADNLVIANAVLKKYPENRKKSAIMPLLTLAQKQNNNYLSLEAMDFVAEFLDVPAINIYEVANFYTMYNLEPVGKYHVQICSNIACYLRGSHDVISEFERNLNIKKGETTPDNNFTVSAVECLAACAGAPAVQINDNYVEDVQVEHVKVLIEDLKSGKAIPEGSMLVTNSKQ